MKVSSFIENTSYMMLSALLLALILGGFPDSSFLTNGDISMIALIVMMTFSLSMIDFNDVIIKNHANEILNAVVLSFGILTGITLLISFLFIDNYHYGWVLEAAVPSAVTIISFTYVWRGNPKSSTICTISLYFISLIITPIITFLFIGQSVSEITLFYYVFVLLLIPIILSRGVKRLDISISFRNKVINVAFFFLILTIIGANKDVFLDFGTIVLFTIILAVIRIFGTGLVSYWIFTKKHWNRDKIVSSTLFITYKNSGMAGAIALVLIGPEAAIPPAICTFIEVIWLIIAGKFLFPGTISKGIDRVRNDEH